MTEWTLPGALEVLEKHYGQPSRPPTKNPFELIIWENVAYLATPERRREAFEQLRRNVGTSPDAILSAGHEALERVTAHGILKSSVADKLRDAAALAVREFGGDLAGAIEGPLAEAKRALRSFPGIGEPGAEKILLFTGLHPFLAPESNGLRVLVRLGFIHEETSCARTYAASRRVEKELPAKTRAMQVAHLLLQEHGRNLCTRTSPRCEICPLASGCAYVKASRGKPAARRRSRPRA